MMLVMIRATRRSSADATMIFSRQDHTNEGVLVCAVVANVAFEGNGGLSSSNKPFDGNS